MQDDETSLHGLSSRIGKEAIIQQIDVDKNPSVSQAYQIRGLPSLILFLDGKILWGQSGVLNAAQVESVIKNFSEITEKIDLCDPGY